jgi:hypothetical protein
MRRIEEFFVVVVAKVWEHWRRGFVAAVDAAAAVASFVAAVDVAGHALVVRRGAMGLC